MDSDNNNCEDIYYPEDVEYRVDCDICDNLCIERFYIILLYNDLKSQTHTIIIRKKDYFK